MSEKKMSVLFRASFRHNTIYDVLKAQSGWRETESDSDWDFNWADTGWIREFYDHIHLDEHQRVNHFRNHYELTRKDLLVKNLKRMRKNLARSNSLEESEQYDFSPTSFVLPAEYSLFVEEFKRSPSSLWIMKPIGKAQGRGIFLFSKLSQISDWKKDHRWKASAPQQAETYIVQEYVERPMTIGGKKFDLRLYVLVTSFTPLIVWIYRSGFARFSSTRYAHTSKSSDLTNLHMHLTNVAIQKTAADYNKEQGCKWSLRRLKLFMVSKHGRKRVDAVFAAVQSMILRSLFAVQHVIIQDKHSFELYGYDVLFDEDLKPWLIEVNASPSLSAETPEDYELKYGLLEDTLAVVDVEGKRKGDETSIGGFDLVWNNGPPSRRPPAKACSYCSSQLGCFHERPPHSKAKKAVEEKILSKGSTAPRGPPLI